MKKIALLLLLPILALADNRVASHFLNDPERYEDKKITLSCAYVERVSGPVREGDFDVVFQAYTVGRKDDTGAGFIFVTVLPEDASDFARKYGADLKFDSQANVKIRPLSGIFRRDSEGWYLEYGKSE
ncbi:MAG: hypothetical protein WC069_06230 [Candidatus Shapirobacteria bacterium]